MDQQYSQYNSSRSTHDTNTYQSAEQQTIGCGFGFYPTPSSNPEWFHFMLLPDSLGSIYHHHHQPLPYLENMSGSTPQYWTGPPIEASRSQPLVLPQGVPTVAAVAPVAPVASVASASVHTPSWDTLGSREESHSPAEDREEEVWEPEDLRRMGYLDSSGNWRCRYEGCRSTRVFVRACDLRKHFRGHDKYFFCTERPCAGAGVGFSTKKDYQRHMGSHQPAIQCPHPDCGRIFSRKDNMREHFRKIHMRLRNNLFPRPCRRSRRASEGARSPPAATNVTKDLTWAVTMQGAGLRQSTGVTRTPDLKHDGRPTETYDTVVRF
ncbi:hypothetical protein LY78DRAFT_739348 [Colletotrichum sublineola]|nr:hypothetical protein LY78DRAFT_739348 [Colletotrichum sublineola]